MSEAAINRLSHELEAAQLDIAVANGSIGFGDSFRTQRLYTERYVVIFPPAHRFAQLDVVRLADLHGEDYVDRLACEMRDAVLQVLQQREVQLYARFRSEREDWVQAMVLAGLGFAFMPEHSVTVGGLLTRPLADPGLSREVCAVEVRGRLRSPASAFFLRELAGVCGAG